MHRLSLFVVRGLLIVVSSLVAEYRLLEKAMAPHSSTLAWKIQWTQEPGRLQVHGVVKSQTQLSDFTFTHWRRIRHLTPVFLPGESQGQGSLVGCRLWSHTESDKTEAT